MSGTMTGGMQGMGAAGTGYGGSSGNSLLQQLVLRALMSGGGGTGGFTPQSPTVAGAANVSNSPLSGLLMPQQRTSMGMNPQVSMPATQMQGNTGASSLGGANLQSLLQALQNQQKMQNQTPYTGTTLTQGIGNLLSGNAWSGMPTTATLQGLQNQANQNVAGGAPGL